jgi:ribosomal protein S18 acetylase RimI-like enzyme
MNLELTFRPLSHTDEIPYHLLLDADPSREMVDKYLPGSNIYVAVMGSHIIGVLVLYPVAAETVEIKNIAVREDLQGQGIGARLLAHAQETARAGGATTLIIGTSNASIGQLYLYQKAGFEMTELRNNFFIDNYKEPLYENGLQVRHMIMLAKAL